MILGDGLGQLKACSANVELLLGALFVWHVSHFQFLSRHRSTMVFGARWCGRAQLPVRNYVRKHVYKPLSGNSFLNDACPSHNSRMPPSLSHVRHQERWQETSI